MKRAIFIDRDGTLITEPQDNFQIDDLKKLEFIPKVIRNLYRIRKHTDYELVIVTNQDGLGTESFPEEAFLPAHELMLKTFEGEGITFDDILIDRSFPADNSRNRKPKIGMLEKYIDGSYDLGNSFVIGDRKTDIELAANLGAQGILLGKIKPREKYVTLPLVLSTEDWDEIGKFIIGSRRSAQLTRISNETSVKLTIRLDGRGRRRITTGIGLFNHMLDLLAKHAGFDLDLEVTGDLHVDEHHTIEDVALTLGSALVLALGEKCGIGRYGFTLPMDECLCTVAVDLCDRHTLVWDAEFKREMIGKMPTEMFRHFFDSFASGARMALHIKAEGENEHHKIEGIFKALGQSLRMAVKLDPDSDEIPSTKGFI